MSRRPLNDLETRLHKAALLSPNQAREILADALGSIAPDAVARKDALNFLLSSGLFKLLKGSKGVVSFRAVSKGEAVATAGLGGEDSLVFGHIKAAGNEGIWTKHLKAKTNLHQTIIDRSIKTLTQKSLIKRVPSVQHPTRKIYMLYELEPSIALTGGPWYTDNELDTEFIQHLMDACLKFIRDVSFPKGRGKANTLYPISNAPDYPTAQHIRNSLKRARLTTTELTVEHVESLLNVLVLDGKIPSFGSTLWDTAVIRDDESSDEDRNMRKKKKRKQRIEDSDGDDKSSKRKRSKKSSCDSASEDDDSYKRKKSKRKRARHENSDSESDVDIRKKNKRQKDDTSGSDSDTTSEDESERRTKKKKKKKVKRDLSSDESSDSTEDSRSRSKAVRKTKKELSPMEIEQVDEFSSTMYVYRAVKEENVSFGWPEAPCSQCPSFEFCKDGGPVNPQECVYYGDWLVAGSLGVLQAEK
ncbi:RNA polymerase Rpc34 subunit-domain-containing protein [Cyathus striatus]|nr:RNA polymerase Rpc34 subunit-domain-containing protein [Cyathus striatus]